MLEAMWLDQRGSEILPRPECLRLLAMEASGGGVGRLALSRPGAPVVQPVNFVFRDGLLLVQLGDGFMLDHATGSLVALEVDALDPAAGSAWSVLVRGFARLLEEHEVDALGDDGPHPMAPVPGHRLVAVRPDVVTGRRFPWTASVTTATR